MSQKVSVHDPRGYPPEISGKRLAPRLNGLDGKVLFLVDCLFDNSEVFMNQLKDWFAQHLPSVKIKLIKPKESWVDDPQMRARIVAEGDAAILGVGLWSSCSPTVVGLAISLEADGIPTVSVHTHVFARLVKSVANVNGMPGVPQAFVPQPVVGQSAAALRAYIEGDDAIEGGPFIKRLIDGLTGTVQDDNSKLSFDRSTPRLLEPDSEDKLRQKFEENRWTDFMPIVLPTEERVTAMLKGTSHAADEVVGRMNPARFRELWEYTVEKVAVNAVMAGARPEYFPVILALAASGVTARSSSTTSQASLAMVNGPVRNEIGMNAGIGAMGPYNHANTTIGRAYGLLSQNLQGGSVPNESFMGTQGNVHSYSSVFAENEERSPWEPFHVQQGFKPEESTVSIFMGGWYIQFGGGPRETWEEKFRRSLAACDPFSGPILTLDPLVARGFVDKGFDTKAKLIQWCVDNSLLPAREYWDNQWVQTLLLPQAVAGIEPYASHLKVAPDEEIKMFRPEDISVVVVGGETGAMWKILGGSYMASVSVDAWR